MNKMTSRMKTAGFTIVELLVVIVVIGILVAITTLSYQAIQNKTYFATIDNDMKDLNSSIEKYYSKNGSYPTTSGAWKYRAQDGNAFIPGLSPDYYTGNLPDVTTGSKTSNTDNTYAYRSNATDYKILRLAPSGSSTLAIESSSISASMVDANGARAYRAWGYWSPGAASW